jgi:subtilisin-like proprotein convertase family protein
LYVVDDSSGSTGSIAGGWSLAVTTVRTNGSAAPTISNIPDQFTTVNTPTAAIPFTINDADTLVGNLTLSAASSNPALAPTNNIVFGGSGSNRTVTVTPATGQSGTATITVTVSDGTNSANDSFVLTVNAVNTPPTITGIADQTINLNTSTGPLSFAIGDVETAAGSLTLSGASSNPTLVPTNNIVFGGSGANRTVAVSPATNQTGSATITVGVSDGQITTSTNFAVTVSSSAVGTKSFTNAAAITIPDSGAATPYPSVINVAGMDGTISNVTVTLRNLIHTWKSDVDAVLLSPAGQKVMVMSDVGSAYTASGSVTITLSDAAAASLPASTALSSGTYKPTNYTDSSPGGDNFPAPAPAGPYASTLSTFNGQSPNGTWSLFVFDDGPGDLGSFGAGWSITITTANAAPGPLAGPPPFVSVGNPPKIISLTFDQGDIALTLSGEVGLSYALEASSDLVNWTKVKVQDNTTGSLLFRDRPTTNAIRFYRAVSVPK